MCNKTKIEADDSKSDANIEVMDLTTVHSWIFESETADSNASSLTTAGVQNIAAHKYVPGHYTVLDNFLNPAWNYLTELLPIWLAPNMVTTTGGLHCLAAYMLIWYYSPNFDQVVPDWVLFIVGYCIVVYYTLDCMDGKQARRTQTSSPLGQLFDHGFDCICTMVHCAAVSGFCMNGGTKWYFVLSSALHFSFFMAQWEEYYTHKLPHAMGNVGVTEVNYAIGLFTMANAFIDREWFWRSPIVELIPEGVANALPLSTGMEQILEGLQMNHIGLVLANLGNVVLVSGSMYRVMTYSRVCDQRLHLSAISKLFTLLLITVTPFFLPAQIIQHQTRLISISMGLLCCHLTIKMICFSMAKMQYAAIQIEAIPYFLVCTWISWDDNFTFEGRQFVLGVLCFWYMYRLLSWIHSAIDQICEELDIYCFTIKRKMKTN